MVIRSKSEVRKIRNSAMWRNVIRPAKMLSEPYCQKCIQEDELIEAVHVDHIIPLEHGGEPFEKENLQSLCLRCHVIKSSEEARQRRRRGLYVVL